MLGETWTETVTRPARKLYINAHEKKISTELQGTGETTSEDSCNTPRKTGIVSCTRFKSKLS